MRRFFRELAYDLKEPGIHIKMIPLAALLFLLLAFLVEKNITQQGQVNYITLSSLEVIVPALGGYGAIMLMQGLLDTEGGGIFFTYHRTLFYWGLWRQLRFFAVFTVLVALVCLGVSAMMHIAFLVIFPLTLAQCFSVMGVAFLGVTLSRMTKVGLIVLIAYIGIQIILGKEYEVLNLIYMLDGSVPSPAKAGLLSIFCVLTGGFGYAVGQIWVRP